MAQDQEGFTPYRPFGVSGTATARQEGVPFQIRNPREIEEVPRLPFGEGDGRITIHPESPRERRSWVRHDHCNALRVIAIT
jgi:hypothetical protein